MAPQQNTFTLVPNPLGMQGLLARPANPPTTRPMTSKQIQKLAKQKQSAPVSRAQQRLEEQALRAQLKKEQEQEKQAKRTRQLRDRKNAREQQARDERRKKGMPLVDVHPSQDTIARFVRPKKAGCSPP